MELPLFPLNTVLFPGALLPLHIFEPRYRQMIGELLATGDPTFGLLLIKEGDEVVERPGQAEAGRPAVPHDVGTAARIVQAQQLPDGRYFLVCAGEARIRLHRIIQSEPFLIGEVEPLADEDEALSAGGDAAGERALQQLAGQARGAVERLLAAIEAAIPDTREAEKEQLRRLVRAVPADPAALSFFIPRTLTTASNEERQRLLETRSARRRLQLELPLVLREQQVIQQIQGLGASGRLPGDPDRPGSDPFGAGRYRPSVN